MAGEHIDLASELPQGKPRQLSEPNATRPFLGINFACCAVYSRIYMNADSTAFTGRCPRCARPVTVRIGPDGSNDRFFTVG